MKWLTAVFATFLVAAVLGAPLTSTNAQHAVPSHLLDQGDGSYIATVDENGNVDVKFTPMAVLLAQDAALAPQNVAPKSLNIPDEDIYCAGNSQNEKDLDTANEKVLKWVNGTEFQAGSWGWIHFNKETSYVCPYQAWVGDSTVVLAAHTTITRVCNSRSKYGWVRFRGTETSSSDAPPDFSVGRTSRGNHFCADDNAPPGNPDDHDEESLDLRDGLPDHDKAAVAQFAIPTHLREQGDGLYVASRDELGKVNVNFTSKEILLASNLAGNTAPSVGLFELPDKKTYKYDYHCTGASKNTYDLVWAHEAIGKYVSDVIFPPETWVWIQNVEETSFFCNYRKAHVDFTNVLLIHKLIDKECGSKAKYGHVQFLPPTESKKRWESKYFYYSVGRTFRGDEFCKSGFHPASLDQRDTPLVHADVPRDDIVASQDQGEDLLHQRDESFHQVESSMDQGDGMYTATFDDTGKMNVAFTSKAELVTRDAEAAQKRSIKTWCSGVKSKNTDDLTWAIAQLGTNAEGVHFSSKHWGWVHNGQETAFFCPYDTYDGSWYNILELNKRIDEGCGSRADYGFFRHQPRKGDKGLPNYSVGRTFRGDHFCDASHAPGSVQQGELDQGDGIYAAVLDEETGKVNITFTPKHVILASQAVSDNPAIKSIRALEKRDGVECVDGESKNKADLDFATRKVAEGVEGMRYDPTVWTWFHNNKETVYVCCYRAWHGSSKTVWDYISYINDGCRSETEYGYNHHAARGESDINLSVGRTWRGNKFCDRYHHPNPPSGT